MDHYEELLEQLRNIVNHGDAQPAEYCTNRCGGCDACDKSIDAIETLLAERDAAVEELRGMCWCCANGEKLKKAPMWSMATTCKYMRELGALARSGGKCKCQHWQWRGPQKHD